MCSIYLLAHYLHCLLEYVDFSWNFFGQYKLLFLVDQCAIQMFIIFSSHNSKLIYSFETLSLKPMQGNGVVYLTVLALTVNMYAVFFHPINLLYVGGLISK